MAKLRLDSETFCGWFVSYNSAQQGRNLGGSPTHVVGLHFGESEKQPKENKSPKKKKKCQKEVVKKSFRISPKSFIRMWF